MPRYAAFLRAINIGGRRVKNDDLRAACAAAGFDGVDVFRASGNVVFDAADEPVDAVTARLEQGLEKALGYEVVAFVRDADEIRAIASAEPFPSEAVEASSGKLQIDFLAQPPAPDVREQVLALQTDGDRLAWGERELFWLPTGAMMESDLDLSAIAKLIGPTTRRTKGTVEQIAQKYFAD